MTSSCSDMQVIHVTDYRSSRVSAKQEQSIKANQGPNRLYQLFRHC